MIDVIGARIVMFAAMLVLVGCQDAAKTDGDAPDHEPAGRVTSGPAQRADAIHLLASPTPINWDERGGPDGVPVTVYLFRGDRDVPITISSGALEFRLYDGRVGSSQLFNVPAVHKWRFTAAELRAVRAKTIVGPCYRVPLSWGENPPRVPTLTLLCMYEPTQGRTVASAPVTITMRQR